MAKRAFDIIVSLVGLIIASPLMCAIAVLIKLESRGPIFYSCVRAGKKNSLFAMLKFRTMVDNADNIDCKLCGSGDVRVTRLGSFLRRTKLNELPQLFNVLIGQMSMVGPRPEDPKFLKYYPEQWQMVLSVQPGIAGPNQILNRNEEDAFVASEDPERLYVEQILPDKLDRDIEYVRSHSLFGDFMVLATAAYHTLFKGFTFHDLLSRRRTIQLIFYDTVLSLSAYAAANWVRFETLPLQPYIINTFCHHIIGKPVRIFHDGSLQNQHQILLGSGFHTTASGCVRCRDRARRNELFSYVRLRAFQGCFRCLSRVSCNCHDRGTPCGQTAS